MAHRADSDATEPADITAEIAQLRAQLAASERQRAALAEDQEQLLRVVSHDLRAPLRHVTAFSQLVRETLSDPGGAAEAATYLDTMDKSAKRMGRMIDALAELSRVARHDLQVGQVSSANALEEARMRLGRQTEGRHVVWQLPADLAEVVADPALLRTLWEQLLDNALKFSAGQATAVIAVTCEVLPGQAVFSVRDNGVGFDPARAARLFGIFERLHRESDFDGVGIGLALARRIVERLGGSIAIDAQLGAGCTVRVALPTAGGHL